jgi:hypothetical protein
MSPAPNVPVSIRRQIIAAIFAAGLAGSLAPPGLALAQSAEAAGIVDGKPTTSSKLITPAAAKGALFQDLNPGLPGVPERRAGYAGQLALSPDGRRLAIQTSGFPAYFDAAGKLLREASTEYVFLFDVTGAAPKQLQVLKVSNTFPGLAWSPKSDRLYVSGGKDDAVVEFADAGDR